MSDDYNPFEPDETPEQQNARIGRMIRENVDKRLAAERSAPATPAATPMAVSLPPQGGQPSDLADSLRPSAEWYQGALAEHRLYCQACADEFPVMDADRKCSRFKHLRKFAEAVAVNSEAPQKLQEAAQPQRESEQQELWERHRRAKEWAEQSGGSPGERIYIEAYMHGYFNVPRTSSRGLEGEIIRQFEAVLSPQTDSQEPR